MADADRAEHVILALISEAGGAFEGVTRLYKAFYFAHLYYAERTGKLLTDWPIVRMPRGPGIGDAHILIDRLRDAGKLATRPTKTGPFPSILFQVPPGATVELDRDASDAIREAIAYVGDRTAAELSELSHEHSRSWNMAADGDELDVFLDIMSEDEFADAAAEACAIKADVARIFQDAP